jgi:hypothetical protein
MYSLKNLPSLFVSTVAMSLAVTGCSSAAIDAPFGSSVSVSPSTLLVGNGQTIWFEDNVGLIEFADVTVVNDEALPLENVKVEVKGPSFGMFLIPQQAIEAVDYPLAPEDFKEQRQDTCYDENGDFDNTEDWCAWYYDSLTGSYYDLGESYTEGDGDNDGYSFRPNYSVGKTDSRGRMRIWYFLDAMPVALDGEETVTDTAGNSTTTGGEVSISGEHTLYITIGVDATTFVVTSGQ